MKKFIKTILLILIFHPFNANSQDNTYPVIGKPCPDFVLRNINGLGRKQASLSDFKGKFLILDFWNKGCSACIKSFPKTNELNKQFSGKVTIIVVGTEEEGIQKMYEKFRARYNLTFPTAFDFDLYRRFVYGGAPHLIWIDDKGFVRAVTSHLSLNAENIETFIGGKKFEFVDRSYSGQQKLALSYDRNKPYLVQGNGGDDMAFTFRSLLAPFQPGKMYLGFLPQNIADAGGRVEGIADLYTLYRFAYTGYPYVDYINSLLYGNFYPVPILEMPDTSEFIVKDDSFEKTGEGLYLYSLIVPPSKTSTDFLMVAMQRDLKTYFGYEVRIETRMMPYWKFTASEKARKEIVSKGGQSDFQGDHAFLKLQNFAIDEFLNFIRYRHFFELPIINESGIADKIDLEIKADFADLNDVKRALKDKGLDLIRGEKEMKVLVISQSAKDGKPAP